jgi:peptide deformylase
MSDESTRMSEEARREAEERRARAAAQIRVVGDPVLRERAHEVVEFDDDLRALSERMIGIMHDAPGIGLAATQLGIVRRVLVYDVEPEQGPVTLVNPEILGHGDEVVTMDEGCLSVPGVNVPVEREAGIRVRARDLSGAEREFDAEELEARVIKHELDHLDGVLILDRTTRVERARALRELREREGSPVPRPAGL